MMILFMILVVVGLGTIHTCMKKQIQNEERIINRLDLILLELKKGENPNRPA